jgi:hypothetical protein
MTIKLKIARAQLGTALRLFVENREPISVHALACGGSEVIEGLANQADLPTLSSHMMKTVPDLDYAKIKRLRNQYWNAIKHFYGRDNKTARDDEALMADFADAANDSVLFMGWLDYQLLTKRLPVAAQVFQVWWYASNESRMNPSADPSQWRAVFPNLMADSREEKKRRLRRAVEKYRKNAEILADLRTDTDSL